MNLNSNSLPLGLEMALANNIEAQNRFSSLTDSQKSNFINRSKTVSSKNEMQSLVMELTYKTDFV